LAIQVRVQAHAEDEVHERVLGGAALELVAEKEAPRRASGDDAALVGDRLDLHHRS
jgi:hypothetical protein